MKLLSLILCPILLLFGCASRSSVSDARSSAFCADLRLISEPLQICATAEVAPPTTEGALRDITLTFSAPEALKGLIVTRTNGEISLSFLDLTIECFPVDKLLQPIDLLLCEGSRTLIGEDNIDGVRYLFFNIENKKEGESYEFYVDPHTGIPKEIRTSKETLQIMSFHTRTP